MSAPELTVIVTTHNREALIEENLSALAAQRWDADWDILLVDNDSTDATPAILDRWIDKMPVPVRVLTATDGHCPAYARNAGVAATASTSVIFIDDDDVIAPGFVEAMGTALRDHQFVASRSDYLQLNDAESGPQHTFQTERLGRHFGVPVVDATGSGIRRALYERHGGSDESVVFSEDAEISLRIARDGEVTPHYCTAAVCHVRLPVGTRSAWIRGTRRGFAEVQMYAWHGEHFGARPEPLWIAVGRWARLILQLPTLRTASGRTLWVEALGRRVGRLRGSCRLRRWWP